MQVPLTAEDSYSWFPLLSISKIFMIPEFPQFQDVWHPDVVKSQTNPCHFCVVSPTHVLIQWNSQTTTLTALILLKGFCLLNNSGCIPWWENVGESQSTLIGALFLLGRCSVLPQDCLYLVFELCEGLDLLETIRRSKNGRRFARLGG